MYFITIRFVCVLRKKLKRNSQNLNTYQIWSKSVQALYIKESHKQDIQTSSKKPRFRRRPQRRYIHKKLYTQFLTHITFSILLICEKVKSDEWRYFLSLVWLELPTLSKCLTIPSDVGGSTLFFMNSWVRSHSFTIHIIYL